jgi:uncharacterized membrane protein
MGTPHYDLHYYWIGGGIMAESELKNIGPLQLLAVAFDQPDFKGKIRAELQKLRDSKLIRIVDGLAIQKDKTGKMTVVEESDLTADENRVYGAVIGGLIGIGSGDAKVAQAVSDEVAERFHERYEYGLDKEDVADMTEHIPAGDAAIILLVEHRWAIPLRNAMREAGGLLMSQDFLSPELLIGFGREVLTPGKVPAA